MIILGIETSCDETAAAIVENGTKILSSCVASSSDLHAKTGGIIPEVAARKQVEYIIPIIQECLLKAFGTPDHNNPILKATATKTLSDNVDAIAVTYGPGLIGSLLVGVETAKTLTYRHSKTLIPVNHIIAHAYGSFIKNNKKGSHKGDTPLPLFPAINLVVSGGHTQLLLIKNHNDIKVLGSTRDDAAGEAFDKIARILGLPYPGGPEISEKAEKYLSVAKNVKLDLFPRPMIESDDYDFSFSGLKTSVKNYLNKSSGFDLNKIAAEVQEAIVDSLVEKTIKACVNLKPVSLLLSGGVSANERLRKKLGYRSKVEIPDIVFHVPNPSLSTDNATFIASRAFFSKKSSSWKELDAKPDATILDL
ncbi:tRNA (adenosine(37)-N6)-threonylcarbamoyltransferase complex transferase subunit TsaD [Candidatus Woesebacteria bacterium]|nr:tRNA (adenosine(37)-N6)-threonylcarbamoyltransferase complex transferase subunit TsaD [Candidatus Woesebacteria bacterium]